MTAAALQSGHRPHEPRPPHRPASPLFRLWEQADELVPYPFLYCWLARPHAGKSAATLRHLCHVDFIYGITGNFIIHLTARDGAFGQGIVARQSLGYRLMPIQGRQNLMTPEAAERAIERWPLLQDLEFWIEFYAVTGDGADEIRALECEILLQRYRALPWLSLRLERPLRAGQYEPFYRFRKAGTTCEFWVGAMSGTVRHEHVREPVAPPPPPFEMP